MRSCGFGVWCFCAAILARSASGDFVVLKSEISHVFSNDRPSLKLPLADGSIGTFDFVEDHLLPIGFSASIRTLQGKSRENSLISAHLVLTPDSVAAQIFTPSDIHFLSSRSNGVDSLKIVPESGLSQQSFALKCLTEVSDPIASTQGEPTLRSQSFHNVLRRFRLAPAATAEFTEFFGSKEEALRQVVTAMSRANGIFSQELGISFRLVPGFEQMIFTDKDADPYTSNEPTEDLMKEAQAAFDGIIGTENYDLGIVLTRGFYGLTYIRSVCDPLRKGSSCVGFPEPTGDAFHVALVTHELAHQFGANHTFNSPNGLCGERRNHTASFEPGAGSTIMSYASAPCEDDSFQPWNDPYFHSENLKEILTFVNSSAAFCAEIVPRENNAPELQPVLQRTIPARTPFALTVQGFDPNGDLITYCWEQRDLGPARTLDAPDDGLGPLFRSFPPTLSPTRLFPRLEAILAGGDTREERLPGTNRVMRFRVTARDSHKDGAVSWTDTQLQVLDLAPGRSFRITSHNTPQVIGGSTLVQWDVAGTTNAPIRAMKVRITLSTNGGRDFSIVLAELTPNDGAELVQVPPIPGGTADARIKVEPIDNIFFDINDSPLTIGKTDSTLRLIPVRLENGGMRISWSGQVGKIHRLERSSSLAGPPWVEMLRTNSTTGEFSVELLARGEADFYRVVQE